MFIYGHGGPVGIVVVLALFAARILMRSGFGGFGGGRGRGGWNGPRRDRDKDDENKPPLNM
jgi:hypothetical protein